MQERERGNPHGAGAAPAPEVVLAGVARAVLHRPGRGRGTPFWTLLEHLAITRRSATARSLRASLAALEQGGLLTRHSEHGVPVWALTAAGERRLGRALRSADPPSLPEAPQHLAWRRARLAAGEELGRFLGGLSESLARAEQMLAGAQPGAGEAPCSDDWFELGRRLLGDCRRLGSAWHCLHEWPEPEDSRADLDTAPAGEDEDASRAVQARNRALRAGRRNTRLWSEPD
jgi:hypothetical protein